MKISIISGILSLVLVIHLSAQEESFPCSDHNPYLKQFFSSGHLDNLYVHSCFGEGLGGMCSSFLMPSGDPPEIIEDPDGPPDDGAYVAWTCRYSPGNLQDGNIATAWVEGEPGQGIGEIVIVPCLNLDEPVEIFAGYGKSEKLFSDNSRPRRIRLAVIEAKMEGHTQYGILYNDLNIITDTIAELKDLPEFQRVEIPDFDKRKYVWDGNNTEMECAYFLGIEIRDVYAGSRWDDCCISEIRNMNIE